MSTHGDTPGVDVAAWCGDDPDIALVGGDLHAWSEAHDVRCECEALCTCGGQP